jgi:hypothetical protein
LFAPVRGVPFPFLIGVLGIWAKLLCSIISTEPALPVNPNRKIFWSGWFMRALHQRGQIWPAGAKVTISAGWHIHKAPILLIIAICE